MDDLITKVDIDCHRWYAFINVHHDDGTVEKTAICTEPGEGIYVAEAEDLAFFEENGYWNDY